MTELAHKKKIGNGIYVYNGPDASVRNLALAMADVMTVYKVISSEDLNQLDSSRKRDRIRFMASLIEKFTDESSRDRYLEVNREYLDGEYYDPSLLKGSELETVR